MDANEDDDMEVDDDQELVIVPVRDKGKDAKFLKAYSNLIGYYKPIYFISYIVTSVTSMAALERHQKAKHSNRTFCSAECGVSQYATFDCVHHSSSTQTRIVVIEPINLWSSFATFKSFGLFSLEAMMSASTEELNVTLKMFSNNFINKNKKESNLLL